MLWGIVLLAAALRLAGIGDRLSADEGYSWLVASAGSLDVFLDRLAAYENTPPLFYALLAPLPLDDEAWLRLPSHLASVTCVPVLYAAVRPLLGERVALLSALALAVAPYHVSFANYSRSFMLASLGCLLALWAAARLAEGADERRWWALYAAGATVAVWSSYASFLFLAALAAALLWAGVPGRGRVLLWTAVPVVLFLPWLPELLLGLDALDVSKVAPDYPEPTPAGLRDVLVPLFFGEHGAAGSEGLRWLQLLALLGLLALGARRAGPLLGGTAVALLGLHAACSLVGPDVFAQRYLTALIPLGCVLAAQAVVSVPWRPALPLAAAALLALGAAVFATRVDRELEPDWAPVRAALAERGGRPVLTNSAVGAYYLRDLDPLLDRPFGLGSGRDTDCVPPHCATAFAIADDTRVAGGARPGPGEPRAFGPIVVRLEPQVEDPGTVRFGRGIGEAGDRVNPLACALAALVASSFGAPPTRHLEVTVQDDALMLHSSPAQVGRTARTLRNIGADRLRVTAGWSALAPSPRARRKPAFDATDSATYPAEGFRRLDTAVKAAKAAGIDVQIDIAFWAPRWAVRRATGGGDRQRWAPNHVEFARFARAVAGRYSGAVADPTSPRRRLPAVRLWTTWNEPNHSAFLLPQWQRTRRGGWRPSSPHVYRRLHEAAYDQIKAVSSDNQVLLGGLAAFGAKSPGVSRGMDPLPFTRALACVDDRLEPLRVPECRGFRALRADGFAIHPYSPTGAPDVSNPDPDTAQIADLERLSGLLGELHGRGRISSPLPLYVTEYGYETNPPDPTRGVPLDVQARWHGLATFLAWQRPDTRMFAQFLLRDLGPDPRHPAGSPKRWRDYQTGLLTHRGDEKPSLQAFKLPFWAEARVVDGQPLVVAFGQVRPGRDPQRMVIEAQGGDGVWRAIASLDAREAGECREGVAEFRTDVFGFYVRALPYEGALAYRPRWIRPDGRFEYGTPVAVGAPLPGPAPPAA